MSAPHILTITHNAESHEYDCHDDCTATLTCPGVTDSCRCWWECATCHEVTKSMDDDVLDEYDDQRAEAGEAHGVEHQHIDCMWMTPTDRCITQDLEHDAFEWISVLSEGAHEVDLDCEEGFITIRMIVGEQP